MTSTTKSPVSAGKNNSAYLSQRSGKRIHGRITKEDIRAASLRRWDGRRRITTDWFNLYHEPELCFASGDILVYLRHPGQSSRGPSFRVHSKTLRERGFQTLLERCVIRPFLNASRECLLKSCPGCHNHSSTTELYIPAPIINNIDAVFDHHITTRNFFAWLYDRPLAGRALGVSLVALKERIDQYRSTHDEDVSQRDVIAYAESQKYLDFRECVDHALAALLLAERFQQEDLWIDAFAHAVGMSNRGIAESLEHPALSPMTQSLIVESRLEMDVRLARASMSIETFLGDDLSGNFLGLSQAAKDHFDRFRSFLHSYYIEKYGFWPPAGFSSETSKYLIYSSLYSDFRNLYHHLVDESSSPDHLLANTGGVCTLQNIQAFDLKHDFDTLPRPLPRLPSEAAISQKNLTLNRRRSWNPVIQKRIEKENTKAQRAQALIDASNRDMTLMNCPLVRRYSEFESKSISDDLEHVSWIDGRKVRWILVYAILQTLISIMAAPKLVRNTNGLSYPLCCRVPKKLPWSPKALPKNKAISLQREIVPDIDYIHSNSSTGHLETRSSRSDRRPTMPPRTMSSLIMRSPSLHRVGSWKKLLNRKRADTTSEYPPVPSLPAQAFCEILVHGYGNGLNEVDVQSQQSTTIPTPEQMKRRNSLVPNVDLNEDILQKKEQTMPHISTVEDDLPALSPSSSAYVSRETSNASSGSTKTTSTDEDAVPTPIHEKNMTHLIDILKASAIAPNKEDHTYDEIDGFSGVIHINTKTWDAILS